ncbi:MAG: carbon-nitrogen hydrolase family protein, partial [Chloroflexota bacterium]
LTHTKTYLPDDEGFWEATWYDRGTVDFQAVTAHNVRFGYMICTEIWFMQHIREYGQQGTHFILCPRSTPLPTNDKWLACGRTAGVIGGGFCLSSNHAGAVMGMELGGTGWITDPESVVLGVTSAEQPFITLDVDLSQAEAAKATYPRYVIDSPL